MPETRRPFEELEQRDDFIGRHIGPGEADISAMLNVAGHASLDALTDAAVPRSIMAPTPMDLPAPRTEADVLGELREMAAENRVFKSLIGQGYHDCVTPPVILRNVMENPGWYTAYTPYQPEISQGRLEALLTFQTMVCDLTGMQIANASLLDEATAAAEAMTLCHRVGTSKSGRFFVAADCHPQTIDVLKTRAAPLGIEIVTGDPFGDPFGGDLSGGGFFGALLQYPTTDGRVADYAGLVSRAHESGALVTVAADLLALTLLAPPGEWGADVVIGSAQRFGVPLGFGGPHAAYLATGVSFKRNIPGRLVGVSVDDRGRPALRLALQTREQHIRRERATSNICTAQVLLAVMAGLYAVYHGPERLKTIAGRVHRLTGTLAAGLERLGFAPESDSFFDTIVVEAKGDSASIHARAREAGINLRAAGESRIGIALDECTARADIEAVWRAFAGSGKVGFAFAEAEAEAESAGGIPAGLRRASPILAHEVFNSHHSETEMLRYLRRLQARDVALDRSMIALGSCTMKLNATTEMIPVTWREFAAIHPFAPAEQTRGYARLIAGLEAQLAAITGFAAVSLQPNAGSQGEFSGLLAIRRYHESRGESGRDVCLIPSSAHGTNPASAVMAGMRVVVVACDEKGNVDVADLEAKAAEHADDLAALMITYPSTHGVFEESIVEICKIVHEAGGQVYMDGANLNALVGLCRPGEFGPDVGHLNLHKTFCVPHGGGGPGVGPIGVGAHLKPFLPGHGERPEAGPENAPAVAAAPWGSAGILPISWAYIALMGATGLRRASQVAILNANYMAKRLAPHYPVLYTGPGGLVAHECIIDLRPLKESAGISVDDVAKRLIDYGFHAPTMSFPVAGTLMIEPTESESRAELNRFCDAMIAIREEIHRVEAGAWPADDNPLVNAPHTAEELTAESWAHPYSREIAVFPAHWLHADKYWPPVGRVDQVYGDRHLICACPPMEAYLSAAE